MDKHMKICRAAAGALFAALLVCLVAAPAAAGETFSENTQAFASDTGYAVSSGMHFSLNAEGDGYTVTGYEDGITEALIPEEYSGLPVTAVDSYAFLDADTLVSLSVPAGVTYMGEGAFRGCTALEYVYFDAKEMGDLETENGVFMYAGSSSGGIDMVIGKDVTRVPASLMFSSRNTGDIPNLRSLTFEEGCAAESIGSFAFYEMDSVKSINIPETVREIGESAFFYCIKWEGDVYLPNIEVIGSGAFTDCRKIETVYLGGSLKEINKRAFKTCVKLGEVTFENPSGWHVSDVTGGEGDALDADGLADPETAAVFLTNNGYYTDSYWYRVPDTEAPVLSGAGDGDGAHFVSSAFTVTATDEGSGVRRIFFTAPGVTGTMSVEGDSVTVDPLRDFGGTNGGYVFYAEDNEGNVSEGYTVFYDDTPPMLSVTGAVFGGITRSAFTVTATDASGSATELYMSPPGDGWMSCGGYEWTADMSGQAGVYSFCAVDGAGNVSDVLSVTLDNSYMSGEIVRDTDSASLYFTWDGDGLTATLDGVEYAKATWVTEEGTHTFTLYSPYGSSVSYTAEIGHFYVAEETVEATCVAVGYTRYRCLQCGGYYDADYTDITSHDYEQASLAGSCLEPAVTTYTCRVCGYSYAVLGGTTGHTYVAVETCPPTCLDEGYTRFVCSVCGDETTGDFTEATGHSFTEEYMAASCTSEGKTVYTCDICGEVYEEITAPATGHLFDGGRYVAANCTRAGGYEYTCSVCGYTYTEESGLPTDHSFTVTVTKGATCTDDGIRHYECDVCGYSYDTVIEASGHSYRIVSVEYLDGGSVRHMVCDICGDELYEELEDGGEYVASYIEYIFKIYSRYVWWILLAVAGIWSIVMGLRYAMARHADDKEKAKKMILNYLVGLVVIAVVLVAAPYLVYGIALLFA